MMATLLYTIIILSAITSINCAPWREISPCIRSPPELFSSTIKITCDHMESFNQIFEILHDKFPPKTNVLLNITDSQLDDLGNKTFAEMNMNLVYLHLDNDNLR